MAEITREELLVRYKAGERNFSGLDFSGLDLSGIRGEELLSQRSNPGFSENYPLHHCIFRGSNFSYVNFSNWTSINFCDFRNAILYGANFSPSSFSGANFSDADMRGVTFLGGEGIGAIFENVDFRGTDLAGLEGCFCIDGTIIFRNCINDNGIFTWHVSNYSGDVDLLINKDTIKNLSQPINSNSIDIPPSIIKGTDIIPF
jgi:uncharacterized protein YjbI with pentapeptide repeats